MVQRIAVIGFVIAIVVAVLAFSRQQAAVEEAQSAAAAQAEAQDGRATAVALSDSAATAQAEALAGQSTAQAEASTQAAAAAQAQAALETAQAEAQSASTRAAALQASATTGANAVATAAAASAEQQAAEATAQAADRGTLVAIAINAATAQAAAESDLATATAALDLAQFALESAQEDRSAALQQAWAAGTEIANQRSDVATAQAILSGAPTSPPPLPTTAPPTHQPTATLLLPSPTPAPTTVNSADLPLTGEFISRDDALRFNMPETWVSGELDNGIVLVGSSESVFQRTGSALSVGMFEIDIVRLPLTNLDKVTANTPISDVMTQVIAATSTGDSTLTDVSEVTVYDINGTPAARVQASEAGNVLVLTVLKPSAGDSVLLVFAYVLPDEINTFLPTLDRMLETVRLSTPQPTATPKP